MIVLGFVGLGVGLFFWVWGRVEIVWLCGWGFVLVFVYGWLMDFVFWFFNFGISI